MQAGEPTDEELRAALEEQMRNLTVEDVVVQTVATLVNLSARRLGLTGEPGRHASAEVDIDQARMGIDAVRALMPLTPQEQAAPLRQALSQLQMAYAQQAQSGGAAGVDVSPPREEEAAAPPPAPPSEPAGDDDDAATERARARSRIWTPPGSS